MYYGALEAGGTKMVCAVGDEHGNIVDKELIKTEHPDVTIPKLIEYFEKAKDKYQIASIGVAAFGPVCLDQQSSDYGMILDTPKEGWAYYPFYERLYDKLSIPIVFDTDVNAACLGEMRYGSAKGLTDVVYITIGTGIGAGIAVNGKLVHGMLHPEAGHISVCPVEQDETNCICKFHANCFEGMASGPSIQKRWKMPATDLYEKMEVWELESEYIAQALLNYIMILSPQRIILGGGVMHQLKLFPMIRKKVTEKIGGYLKTELLRNMDQYIVPADLKDEQGVIGCICLAAELK